MASIESGSNVANKLDIDGVSKAARATIYDPSGNPAVLSERAEPALRAVSAIGGYNDRTLLPARMDRSGGLASALHTPLLYDSFSGTAQHVMRWNALATTMALTQSDAGGVVLNSSSITTVNTGYLLQSTKRFAMSMRIPLQWKCRARLNRNGASNHVMRIGPSDAPSSNAEPVNGAYFEVDVAGVLKPVVKFNNGLLGPTGDAIAFDPNKFYVFDIWKDDDEFVFIVQSAETGLTVSYQSIKLPDSTTRLQAIPALPFCAQIANSGVAPAAAPQLFISDVMVVALDVNANRDWGTAQSAMGRSSLENPFTGAQLQQHANSAQPANATLSNTAASYATLGGRFQFAAVAGAETDYALFGFQVPVGSTLVSTGIDIETLNVGAAVATSATVLEWSIATQMTAVSLATANYLRRGIGNQSFAIGAGIGALAQRIDARFEAPVVCNSGRFFGMVLRSPIGTATAGQVIRGIVNVRGYFE